MNHFNRLLSGIVAGIALGAVMSAHAKPANEATPMESVQHLKDYQVIEFRRYVTSDGELAHFVKYFDAYFPEAFEQLGAMVFGQFTERGHPNHFTWLRGFHDINARPIVNAAFYYGPLWKEHRIKVNAILPDSDNVMLLRPLHAGPRHQRAAGGRSGDRGARRAGRRGRPDLRGEEGPARRRSRNRRKRRSPPTASTACTRPVCWCRWTCRTTSRNCRSVPTGRSWCGWAWSGTTPRWIDRLVPRLAATEQSLAAGGLLRGAPERVVMDPTPRSRLRWLPDAAVGAAP